MRCLGDKIMEARLRWFGHIQRRDSRYAAARQEKKVRTKEEIGCNKRRIRGC